MALTQKIGQPLWLAIMFDGHTNGIEKYENDDKPVEPLRFHCMPYPEAKTFFS